MKKILSFMLVLSMLFSMVSFAIPAVEVVESAAEVADIVELASDDDATLTSEYGDYMIYSLDFEGTNAATIARGYITDVFGASATSHTSHFGDSSSVGAPFFDLTSAATTIGTEGSNHYLVVAATNSSSGDATRCMVDFQVRALSGAPTGKYTFVAKVFIPSTSNMESLENIQFRAGTKDSTATKGSGANKKGQWITVTQEWDCTGAIYANRMQFMHKASDGSTAVAYVDDVQLWYTAPAPTSTITFDVNGNAAATAPSPINKEIGLAFDPSEYVPENTDATKEFAGWATSATGDVVYTFTPSEAAHTLYAVWTTPFVLKDGYVMNLDFEDDTVSANAFVAQNVVYDYSNFDEVDTFKNMNSDKALPYIKNGNGAVYITEYNGNKVLEVTDDANASRTWSNAYLGIGGLDKPGTYRISFKYFIPKADVEENSWNVLRFYTKQNGSDGDFELLATTEATYWYEYTKEIVLEDGETLDEFHFQGMRNSAKKTTPGSFYLDDIKILYIMPKNGYNLTFDVADKYANDVVLPAATKANETGATELWLISEPVTNDTSLVFKGWSLSENGAVIESVTPTQDTTLYAIFEERIHPFFSDDFSTGKNILGGMTSGEMNFYSLTSSIANGIYTATLTDTDTSSNAYGYWFNDVTQNHKYVTADTPLVRDDIKGMSIKYKILTPEFNGSDSFDAVPTPGATPGKSKTDVFAGPANAADTDLKNVGNKRHDRYLDTWNYINMGYADTDSQAVWGKEWPNTPDEIGTFRFDILQQGYDGMQFQVDYVKFILADDRILPTIPAETVMALDGDYSVTFTYPQGLNVTEDEIAPDAFGKYAINFEFVGENQIKVYVNPAYVWDGNVVPVKSPGFMNADSTKTYVTTYYNMAFETLGAPTTLNVAQIRTDAEDDTKQGMRYAAYIEKTAEACEYGYIVTLESYITFDDVVKYGMLVANGTTYNGTAISGRNIYGVPVVGAVAITGTGAQTIYSTTGEEFLDNSLGDGLYFTTVLTGIDPENYDHIHTRFVGRPYVKLTDGTYVHGAPITRSLFEVAKEIYDELGKDSPAYVKTIYMTDFMG